jgi:hypothetical protein
MSSSTEAGPPGDLQGDVEVLDVYTECRYLNLISDPAKV